MDKIIFSFFILLLITGPNVYSQDFTNGISTGFAPYVKVQYPPNLLKDAPDSSRRSGK